MNLQRIFGHLMCGNLSVRRAFPPKSMEAVERAIRESERNHRGEIRFAVEAALDLGPLLRDQSARERAIEVFSRLRVWDTEHNSGVLIYLLLADRDVEIVADRGLSVRVTQEEWEVICRRMEAAFRKRKFEQGVLEGVTEIGAILAKHFPPRGANLDELSDRPVVL